MRIYISGPITGTKIPEALFRFNRAERKLKRMGYEVVNPTDMAMWGVSWRTYMAIAKVTLSSGDIDAIYFMPGWTASRGCNLEMKWAKELGIETHYNIRDFERIKENERRDVHGC